MNSTSERNRSGTGRIAFVVLVTLGLLITALTVSERPSEAQADAAPVLTLPDEVTEVIHRAPFEAVVDYVVSAVDDVDGVVTPICSPASGSIFQGGRTTVECSATDSAGNTASGSFDVVLVFDYFPTVAVPGDITVEATSSAGAEVVYSVRAFDAVEGPIPPVCRPPSGEVFEIGVTTVECSATDRTGNTTTESFTVTVLDGVDDIAPVLTLPDEILEFTGRPPGTDVTYSATAIDAIDGPITPSCTPASGSQFLLGRTRVDCTATDSAGNTAFGSFIVTVAFPRSPRIVLRLPSAITASATSAAGAAVSYTATAIDPFGESLTPECVPASGEVFEIGVTTVECTATGSIGDIDLIATGSFTVTVLDRVDDVPPVLTLPDNVTRALNFPPDRPVAVDYTASAVDDIDGDITPTCTPASGTAFEVGTTTVACTATDSAGNTASGSFDVTVTVLSDPFPSVTVPDDITVEATSAAGAVVSYVATAADVIERQITPVCVPASGEVFEIGVTEVGCTATNSFGNSTTASFTVTVESLRQRAFVEHLVPGRVEAELFDLGGQGVGYSDVDAANRGNDPFREDDGVDVYDRSYLGSGLASSGSLIGSTRSGEWTEYTVTAPTAGTYELVGRVASGFSDPGYIRARVRGVVVGTIDGDTGGWFNWQERSFGMADFKEGDNVVRMAWNGGGQVNFDWFEIRSR